MAWNIAESVLEMVFISVCDIPDRRKAGAIFCSVVAFEARLAMVDAAVESEATSLPPDMKAIWPKLSGKARSLYKQRHQLAHFLINSTPEQNWTIIPYFTWHKDLQGTNYQLGLKDIDERRTRFRELHHALEWFFLELQRPIMPPTKLEQMQNEAPPLILRIQESLARSQSTPKPPPQSS